MNVVLVKRNKRFHVERDGASIYTPRDFLLPHLHGREKLKRLIERINDGWPEIKAIVAFETECRP